MFSPCVSIDAVEGKFDMEPSSPLHTYGRKHLNDNLPYNFYYCCHQSNYREITANGDHSKWILSKEHLQYTHQNWEVINNDHLQVMKQKNLIDDRL